MELVCKKDSSGYLCYKAGDEDYGRYVIKVYTNTVPSDFDPDRTARMIEKMNDNFKLIKLLLSVDMNSIFSLNYMGDFNHEQIKLARKNLDYIENGDKEEMVEVSILPTVHNSKVLPFQSGVNFTKIPKSEAIRLKIIKE